MMYWYDHDLDGWGYAWMSIGMVLFWGLLIAGFVILVRLAMRPDPSSMNRRELVAEQLLAERFARGEIDEKEYTDRLATLRRHLTAGHS
ncbi:SHOCT domain-containing protein [Nocardia pseudovaccinii]|uniref:SHOCT domain-containing protein n=1 Tax=Nocardia pseudovaccinii TaxID=189540 RepID=UPI003D8B3851